MASIQMFEATLKEVVQAKRLSASKMTKLTEITMKSLSHDTELVLVLFKTHKGLASSQKVSSLYVFDALVRAAHSHVVKHSVVVESAPGKGNAATFLAKIEGIVEGLFQDMISSGAPEAQEKTKKILDIWIKANALPPAMLKRLGDIVKDKAADQKEPPKENLMSTTPQSSRSPTSNVTPSISGRVSIPLTQPSQPAALPSTAIPTTTGTEGLQSTLLALLTQAATQPDGGNFSQTGANHSTAHGTALLHNAALATNQLALLQQLARTAKTSAGGQDPLNQAAPHLSPFVDNTVFPPGAVPILLPTDPRAHGNGGPVNAPRYEPEGRHQGGGRRHSDDHDRRDWDNGRDSGRGRGRGRGRGGYHGGWDDRSSHRDRDQNDRESLSPRRHMRRGRSRSRSPPPRGPRSGGAPRRDYRARSPTRSDPRGPQTPTQPAAIKSLEPGKDEFGRDIRPGSVDPEKAPAQPILPIPAKILNTQVPPLAQGSTPDPQLATVATTNGAHIGAAMPIATYESRERDTGTTKGLDSFDLTTFDFTSPASWEALGKAWEVTNGVVPTQETLMQFMMMSSMSMGMGMGAGAGGFEAGQQPNQWEGAQGSEGWHAEESMEWTDSGIEVVEETQDEGKPDDEGPDQEKEGAPITIEGSVGSTGKMQKVGDRWVFVRS